MGIANAHVVGRANHGPSSSCIGSQHFRNAKVAKLQDTATTAENVIALQIPVNYTLQAIGSFFSHVPFAMQARNLQSDHKMTCLVLSTDCKILRSQPVIKQWVHNLMYPTLKLPCKLKRVY